MVTLTNDLIQCVWLAAPSCCWLNTSGIGEHANHTCTLGYVTPGMLQFSWKLHSTNSEVYNVVLDVSSVTVVSASLCVCITACLTVSAVSVVWLICCFVPLSYLISLALWGNCTPYISLGSVIINWQYWLSKTVKELNEDLKRRWSEKPRTEHVKSHRWT